MFNTIILSLKTLLVKSHILLRLEPQKINLSNRHITRLKKPLEREETYIWTISHPMKPICLFKLSMRPIWDGRLMCASIKSTTPTMDLTVKLLAQSTSPKLQMLMSKRRIQLNPRRNLESKVTKNSKLLSKRHRPS